MGASKKLRAPLKPRNAEPGKPADAAAGQDDDYPSIDRIRLPGGIGAWHTVPLTMQIEEDDLEVL